MVDVTILEQAAVNKLQITITYMKESGEVVSHTGGIYEIGPNKKGAPSFWLWDTEVNDHIRNFLLDNIQNVQVLDIPFIPPQPYPIKINGIEVG